MYAIASTFIMRQ